MTIRQVYLCCRELRTGSRCSLLYGLETRQDPPRNSHLSKIRNDSKERLYQYEPPKWAEGLRWKPRTKIDLCQKKTPIHKWYLPHVPEDFEVYIKREDLTGGAISGHKIRRMEFNLAEALENDCDTVIGCGAITSNNCRTLAVAAKELGFIVHLCLFNALPTKENLPFHGNLYVDTLLGAHLHLHSEPTDTNALNQVNELSKNLSNGGHSPYILGKGEYGDVGLFGYVDCFEELMSQAVTEEFSDLVFSCGTGLTAAAFIIGNERNGRKLRLHGLSITRGKAELTHMIIDLLKNVGFLPECYQEDDFQSLANISDGSLSPGYAVFNDNHVDFVSEVAKSSGILLDPIYTGKSACHLVTTIQRSPETFQGKKILFYNTGSVLGVMNQKLCQAVNGRYQHFN